ncbi:TetR/AcrR family transcriptional regulator [Sulfurimonas sp. HSL-1716]|uniref:TetR/AcrR family transcriptional regulator n=1 Tax=Hydrocurvibacter sulfurireducens TaxID=3131937 RepID=UPI0031F8B9BF
MKETTRQKLIDATFEEVYSHGYQGAALTEILKNAGVHKGSMYHFFGSKKEMALAAIEEKVAERNLAKYVRILELENGYLQALADTLSNTKARDFRRGCPIANIVQEMSNLDEDFDRAMKAIYKKFRDYLKRILDKAFEAKEMKECDTDKMALFITSTVEGAILSAKASGDVKDYEDTVDMLISVLWQYKI